RRLPPLEQEAGVLDLAGLNPLPVEIEPAEQRADVPSGGRDRELPRLRALRAAVGEHQVDPLLPPLPLVQLVRDEERRTTAVVGPGDGSHAVEPPRRPLWQDLR